MAQKHSSVFHTGIIGFGLRTATKRNSELDTTLRTNTRCLIAAVTACCQAESPQACLDAVITVALLLVELISPDVMYNGLPWPEEDFCKVIAICLYIKLPKHFCYYLFSNINKILERHSLGLLFIDHKLFCFYPWFILQCGQKYTI